MRSTMVHTILAAIKTKAASFIAIRGIDLRNILKEFATINQQGITKLNNYYCLAWPMADFREHPLEELTALSVLH
jgi:hypothetical protein